MYSIGKLPKGLRPDSIPRGQGELSKYVLQWDGWGAKQKNTGSEQFRYLVRTMFEIESLLKSGEKTISDFKAQLRGWRERVKEQERSEKMRSGASAAVIGTYVDDCLLDAARRMRRAIWASTELRLSGWSSPQKMPQPAMRNRAS